MNDTFIKTSLDYIKDLKGIKNKKFYFNNIKDKQLYLSTYDYISYENAINKLIIEINEYISDFKKKFKDTYQLHKKEYDNFANSKSIIFNTPKSDLILTWENIKNLHKEYKRLAEKCVSDEVYSGKISANIRINKE